MKRFIRLLKDYQPDSAAVALLSDPKEGEILEYDGRTPYFGRECYARRLTGDTTRYFFCVDAGDDWEMLLSPSEILPDLVDVVEGFDENGDPPDGVAQAYANMRLRLEALIEEVEEDGLAQEAKEKKPTHVVDLEELKRILGALMTFAQRTRVCAERAYPTRLDHADTVDSIAERLTKFVQEVKK